MSSWLGGFQSFWESVDTHRRHVLQAILECTPPVPPGLPGLPGLPGRPGLPAGRTGALGPAAAAAGVAAAAGRTGPKPDAAGATGMRSVDGSVGRGTGDASGEAAGTLPARFESAPAYIDAFMRLWLQETAASLCAPLSQVTSWADMPTPQILFVTRVEAVSHSITRVCCQYRAEVSAEFVQRAAAETAGVEPAFRNSTGTSACEPMRRVAERSAVLLSSPSCRSAAYQHRPAIFGMVTQACTNEAACGSVDVLVLAEAFNAIFVPASSRARASAAALDTAAQPLENIPRKRPRKAPEAAEPIAPEPAAKRGNIIDDTDFGDAFESAEGTLGNDVPIEVEQSAVQEEEPVGVPAAPMSADDWLADIAGAHGVGVVFAWPLQSAVTALREGEALLGFHTYDADIRRTVLDPKQAAAIECAKAASGLLTQEYRELYLTAAFNPSQREAIEAAAGEAPITLIQGPPGTGKSTTIVGALNTLHLRGYADYHDTLLGASRLRARFDALRRGTTTLGTSARPPQVTHAQHGRPASAAVENNAGSSGKGSSIVPDVVAPTILGSAGSVVHASVKLQEGPVSLSSLLDAIPAGATQSIHSGDITRNTAADVYGCVKRMMFGREPLATALEHTAHGHAWRPRILVTAPSNTAVDGLVMKIVKNGLRGASLAPATASGARALETYRPPIIRVGEGASGDVRAAGVFMEQQVDALLKQSPGDIAAWRARIDEDRVRILAEIDSCRRAFQQELDAVRSKVGAAGADSTDAADQHVWRKYAGKALSLTKALERNRMKGHRCRWCGTATTASSSRGGGAMDVRRELRNSLLEEAEIVFSTNSSSGLASIETFVQETGLRFNIVVMDEAAQAVEPSTLIPFRYGCDRVVLVGDPAQLPATVISKDAVREGYDRSLFARFVDAGHPFYMLAVQYRSHPAISAFPARAFYQGRLQDSPEICAGARRSDIHTRRCFQPLMLYDVQRSAQSMAGDAARGPGAADADAEVAPARQRAGGPSWSNASEARLVLALLDALHEWHGHDAAGMPVAFTGTVGVISFYRGQVQLLKDMIAARRRAQPTRVDGSDKWPRFSLDVNTVDGFQGQERDIIILSCVRSLETLADETGAPGIVGRSSTIGFLGDVRRINVALTRAKYSCWVVGNVAALRTHPTWAAFVEHCRSGNALIPVPAAAIPDATSLLALEAARTDGE